MSTNAGISSSPPVTYPNQTAGRTPKTLNAHTRTIAHIPSTIAKLKSKPPAASAQVESENHSAWISVPTTSPLIASTLDHANQ